MQAPNNFLLGLRLNTNLELHLEIHQTSKFLFHLGNFQLLTIQLLGNHLCQFLFRPRFHCRCLSHSLLLTKLSFTAKCSVCEYLCLLQESEPLRRLLQLLVLFISTLELPSIVRIDCRCDEKSSTSDLKFLESLFLNKVTLYLFEKELFNSNLKLPMVFRHSSSYFSCMLIQFQRNPISYCLNQIYRSVSTLHVYLFHLNYFYQTF